MEIEIRNKRILRLYREGESTKYRLGATAIEKFFMRIEALQAATFIQDLWKSASLHFEKMAGYENRFSIRIDGKFRLEIEIEWKDADKTTGKIIIAEISKHYE